MKVRAFIFASSLSFQSQALSKKSLLTQKKSISLDPKEMTTYNSQKTKGYFSVAPEYRNSIPDARDITWDDTFFQNEDGGGSTSDVVAVFDFDYDQMIDFYTPMKFIRQFAGVGIVTGYLCLLLMATEDYFYAFIPIGLYVFSGAPFLLIYQIRWQVYAQHCAVTRDGIRFVHDQQKTCWGLPMCDKGKESKTVPFDKITDCDIHEPAGNSYLCIPNVLTKVIVDTASSGGGGDVIRHELVLSGLKDPHAFKKLVWSMKRANEVGGIFSYQAPGGSSSQASKAASTVVELSNLKRSGEVDDKYLEQLERGCNDANSHEIPGLLRDIRDELRQNNDLLRQQREENNVKEIV